jgi:leader peptidase (prepilin peptidase)/N-methyltransferase
VAAADVDRFEIPDVGCFAILTLGLLWTVKDSGLDSQVLLETFTRIGFAAGLLFVMRATYRLIRNSEGLGLGDVKLIGAGASWLSWPNLSLALLVAVGAAIMVVVVRRLLVYEKVQANTPIPFGAFLAPAIWIVWFAQAAFPQLTGYAIVW